MTSTSPLPLPLLAVDPGPQALDVPVFISDLHLSDDAPGTLARFFRFLAEEASAAGDLVILGDLFESWAGDDEHGEPGSATIGAVVASALRAHAKAGHRVLMLHGNRDFLIGHQFAQDCAAVLMADPVTATVPQPNLAEPVRLLLSHGDAWCTRDLAYMEFRARARSVPMQSHFLSLPLHRRRELAGLARSASENRKRQSALDIMDVTEETVIAAMVEAGVELLVHGHTHRPGLHRADVGGRTLTRCVLPDWDFDGSPPRGGYARIRDGMPEIVALPA